MQTPDVEEYHVLLDALSRAKTTLHSLRVYRQLEGAPAPEGSGSLHLLEFLTRGQKDVKSGSRLRYELEAAELQVAVLTAMLDDYNAREEAARSVGA